MTTDRFSLYLKKRFPKKRGFFSRWNILAIQDDFDDWYVKSNCLKIYAFSKKTGECNAHADIGCSRNVHKRIREKSIKK